MSVFPPTPEPPDVRTTELDRAGQAGNDGWALLNGRWEHSGRVDSSDDGDRVYLGNGVWEDPHVGSLPADVGRVVMQKYLTALAESAHSAGPAAGPSTPSPAPPVS